MLGTRCLMRCSDRSSLPDRERDTALLIVSFSTQLCAAELKLLQEKQAALEREVSELKQQLETEMKVLCGHILLIHSQNTRFLFL